MFKRFFGFLFVKAFGGVGLRLLISLGLATVVAVPGGPDILEVHPVVTFVFFSLNVIAWIATVGSFIISIIGLAKQW